MQLLYIIRYKFTSQTEKPTKNNSVYFPLNTTTQ